MALIYKSLFEDGQLHIGAVAADEWWRVDQSSSTNLANSINVVPAPVPGHGDFSVRFYWDTSWTPYYQADGDPKWRAELHNPGGNKFQVGQEYWLGFMYYIEDNQNNQNYLNNDRYNQSIIQFHHEGNSSTSQFRSRNGQWQLQLFDAPMLENAAPIVRGVPQYWVLHIKPSHGADGFAKAWLNASSDADTPIYEHYGKNISDNNAAVTAFNFKCGIYMGDPAQATTQWNYVEFFMDSFRVGDQTSSFAEVDPTPEAVVTPPTGTVGYTLRGDYTSSNIVTSGDTVVVSGATPGKELFAFVHCSQYGSTTFTEVNGQWSQRQAYVGTDVTHGALIYRRTATGTAADNFQFSLPVDRPRTVTIIVIEIDNTGDVVYSANDANAWLDGVAQSVGIGSITPSLSEGLAIAWFATQRQQDWTAGGDMTNVTYPAGFTPGPYKKTSSSSCPVVALATKALTDQSAITGTWSTSEIGSDAAGGVMVIYPAAAPPPPPDPEEPTPTTRTDVAVRNSTGEWISLNDIINKVPVGGTTGQVLAKASVADYDVAWATSSGVGGGEVYRQPTAPGNPSVGSIWFVTEE